MAPKAKARSAAPKAPTVPAPPSLRVETLDPEQGLPPDWLQRHLHGHYSRQKKQATAASQAIEEALARGDYATAERLDAELEQFYETVENQLQDLDEADPAAAEKGDDETSFGPGSPSVSEQVRDIYGKYLRGELADDFEDVGGQLVRPDQPGGFLPPGAMVLQGSERVPLTPEQALARRLRGVFGGDGFTATGDDLNITGENYNPRGRADALRGISQLPDAQINDMAKDLYAAHEEVKARQRGGGGQSQALVRFLSKHGAYAIPLLASMQQDEAQAAKPGNPSHLALLAAVAQSRRAMESQGIQPEGPSAGVESPAGMKLLGNAPGVNQLMVTGGSAPPAPGRSQLLPPVPPPSGVLEQFTGSDLSQSAVSPREVDRFYTDPAYGRGGDVHRAYIAQAEQLLDQPLIPAGWAMQRFGKDAVAAVGGDGDLSVRQVLAMAPRLELEQAVTAIKSSPKGSPEYNDAVAKIARVKDYAKTNFLAVTRGEDGMATVNMADPYVQQTWGFLTGQNPAYDSSFGKETAGLVLQGIQSGVTGGAFENDPTMSDEDFAALKERYGEKANRMLTPGGVANARREAAFDFLSALHDDPGMNPHIDNFSILMNGVPSRKFEQLADSSAYRGRMGMALDRFRNASAQFEEHEKHGDWRGPFEVQAQNVNRLDPGSFGGVLNLMGSSSWGYGRNVGNPFRQTFDEALTRPGMQDYAFDGRPGDFFRDIRDRTSRETPIRLPGQTYEQNLGTREFARRREEANADYIPTFFPAAIADGINAGRRKFAELVAGPGEPTEKLDLANRSPTNAMAAVSSFPRSIAASPIQMAMVAPGVGAGALKVASGGLKAAPAGAAKAAGGLGLASGVEVGQELVENTAQDPNALSGLLDYRGYSPYLGKRNVDANDRPKWDKAVTETQAELEGDLRKNYRDWLYRTGSR